MSLEARSTHEETVKADDVLKTDEKYQTGAYVHNILAPLVVFGSHTDKYEEDNGGDHLSSRH